MVGATWCFVHAAVRTFERAWQEAGIARVALAAGQETEPLRRRAEGAFWVVHALAGVDVEVTLIFVTAAICAGAAGRGAVAEVADARRRAGLDVAQVTRLLCENRSAFYAKLDRTYVALAALGALGLRETFDFVHAAVALGSTAVGGAARNAG